MCLTSIYFRVPFRPSYCISNLSYVLLYRWQSVFEDSFCLVSPFFACFTRNTSTISYLSLSLLNIGIWTCSRIFSLSKYLRERLWRKSREIPSHFAGCILPEYTSNTLSLSRLWKWRKKFVNKSKALFFHNKITTFEILMAALPKPWHKNLMQNRFLLLLQIL